MMHVNEAIDLVFNAHGGREKWQHLNVIEAHLSSGGLAFTTHGQPFALRHLHIEVFPHHPQVILHGYGGVSTQRGIWTPAGVEIRDAHDRVIAAQTSPRPGFSRWHKRLYWNQLDMLYFAGYALWNYLSFPWILTLAHVHLSMPEDTGDAKSFQLHAQFPATMDTHSAAQVFHLNAESLLQQHDYTAEVIGHWATAAHLCLESQVIDGLRFYTRRKVLPRMGPNQRVWPFPTLVWIAIDRIHPVFACPKKDKA